MSDSTKAALDEAIAAHFADVQDGALVTGYVLQVQGKGFTDVDDDHKTRMLREIAEGQGIITSLGLVDWLRLRMQGFAIEPDDY
jgi:hypothetical protein